MHCSGLQAFHNVSAIDHNALQWSAMVRTAQAFRNVSTMHQNAPQWLAMLRSKNQNTTT